MTENWTYVPEADELKDGHMAYIGEIPDYSVETIVRQGGEECSS
jgi:hypothetical protein